MSSLSENPPHNSQSGLSIVIPLAEQENQHRALIPLLSSLLNESGHNIDFEIIIACLTEEQTEQVQQIQQENNIYSLRSVLCHSNEKGRARQMNKAAQAASYSWLWFLHADSMPNPNCIKALSAQIAEPGSQDKLHYFNLGFYDPYSSMMRLTAAGANFRSRMLKSPFGDQGFLLKRDLFFKLGAYNAQCAYGEDHLFTWQAHRAGVPLQALSATLGTSARKYNDRGWFQQTVIHWLYWLAQAAPQLIMLIKQRLFGPATSPPSFTAKNQNR